MVSSLRLKLVDLECKPDRHGPHYRIDRRAQWIPQRITRASLIRLLGYEGHCSPDSARCWLWIDDVLLPASLEQPLQLHHGQYIRLAVPDDPESSKCATGEALLPDLSPNRSNTNEDENINLLEEAGGDANVLLDITNIHSQPLKTGLRLQSASICTPTISKHFYRTCPSLPWRKTGWA